MSATRRVTPRLTAAAALATSTGIVGLTRLVQPGVWITECLALIVLTALAGHLARARHAPGPLTPGAQLLVSLAAVTALRVHGAAILGFIPGPGALRALADQITAGHADILHEAPPAIATQGISTIVLVLCAVFAVLVDALAVTYQRSTLVGLPLLAVYLVPATRRPGGLSWLAFTAVTIGYLVLVSTQGHERLSLWGRTLGGTPRSAASDSAAYLNNPHSALSRRISVTAILAALILPLFIPIPRGVFETGGGSGPGGGTISISQSVDLRRSLTASTAVPLLRYTTTSKNPRTDYLRMSALDKFDGNSWTADPRTATAPLATGAEVAVPGLTTPAISRTGIVTHITVVGDLSFDTVPAPYAPTRLTGLPDTSFDPSTLVLTAAGGSGRSRRDQQYTVNSVEIAPTPGQLDAADSGAEPSMQPYLSLPGDFPDAVRAQARQITAGDTTAFQQAVALQDFFLSNFTYSLSVPAGDGVSAIQRFLTNRTGFCQQFAGTMAAMARSLGIPAVVAVGFTPGTVQTDGSYTVTNHDAHSWPMLYFAGVGWVRFEPTPSIASSGRGDEPGWARVSHGGATPTPGAGATPTAAPKSTASANACPGQVRKISGGCAGSETGGPAATGRPFAGWGPLGALPRWFEHWFLTGSGAQIAAKLALLALLLLAAVPALGRLTRRRNRRVLVKQAERYLARAADQARAQPTGPRARWYERNADSPMAAVAIAAWTELRECAHDLGYPWTDSDTPRQAADRLTAAARLDEQAAAAIGRVTTLTEQVRYSQTVRYDPAALNALPTDLRTVRTALADHAGRTNRVKAALLPASSLTRLRDRRDRIAAGVYRGTHPGSAKAAHADDPSAPREPTPP